MSSQYFSSSCSTLGFQEVSGVFSLSCQSILQAENGSCWNALSFLELTEEMVLGGKRKRKGVKSMEWVRTGHLGPLSATKEGGQSPEGLDAP